MADNNAEEHLRLAVSKRPDAMEQRAQLASLLFQLGRRSEALTILREGAIYALGREDRLEQLADALLALDALPEALEALQAACRLPRKDERLRMRLEDLSVRLQDGATATRQLFNQYAPEFETHLAALHYKVPDQIATMLQPYIDRFRGGYVIDLGCGTGLMGQHLRGWAGHLAGVDLSPAMIEAAGTKNLYDMLAVGDAVDYLSSQSQVALITAADVLVYIGDLSALFSVVAKALLPQGLFAFTVERYQGEGFIKNQARRVSHSESYVHEVAAQAGLQVMVCEAITPRYDSNLPIDGLMVLLSRP